MWLVLVSD